MTKKVQTLTQKLHSPFPPLSSTRTVLSPNLYGPFLPAYTSPSPLIKPSTLSLASSSRRYSRYRVSRSINTFFDRYGRRYTTYNLYFYRDRYISSIAIIYLLIVLFKEYTSVNKVRYGYFLSYTGVLY
jgi:hypothetical protein